ncbi:MULTISPECIES: substrate-binding domain-containing protein [Paenibacillus]|uniref:ABC transporter substrate-binding protein n=1 Tax=Paenibacillus albilobatus TaxID=2716884 RepID=A0A919XJG4_9BACL|nr:MULTISPECIES: substrate-binding domain-containing protein [Paenibacillus]MDR9853162.1 substrate-binding domain-containing protein [Paenibacillus sp. VCA1]GIO34052.1 ABC transporter substrate-binding protein [Paenibacillus albilobatus]
MRIQRATLLLTIIFVASVVYIILYFKLFIPAPEHERSVTVILKEHNIRSDFWQTVSSGAKAAAKEAGSEITITGPLQETDIDGQVGLLEEVLEQKPQAVVIAPINDDRVTDKLQKIQEAKIPLVIIDTPVNLASSPTFVSNDHTAAGVQAGKAALAQTGNRPKSVIIGDFASSGVSAEREKGVRQALLPYPQSVYGTYYCSDSEERAYLIAKTMMRDHRDLNAIIALNESAALGAAKAIKDQSKTGLIKLIGFDTSAYEIRLLEEGTLNATVVQQPFNIGYLGVQTALDMLDGKKVKPVTYTNSIVVTKANMYSPENQKLLFPFIDK